MNSNQVDNHQVDNHQVDNQEVSRKFSLSIPSKENKQASQLRDGLRIMAWQNFKLQIKENPEILDELGIPRNTKGLDLYELGFAPLWKTELLLSHTELMQEIKKLGYTVSEVLNMRNSYYEKGRGNNKVPNQANEIPSEESDLSQKMPF